MAREFRHALGDTLEAIAGIERATTGKSFEDYQSDWLLKHAVQRAIEIISEASRALPEDVKAIRPEVPWPQVRTIGNVLRHEYHGLSDRIIWGVVIDELPALKMAILVLNEKFGSP
ncbi:DUF86 domain-containing protein [Rhizobium sp. LjRoot98]|jgi:uncharacterized protein with HEPN domain|uniref:HepT-like ribonuclease domain-containing protein n=1 Tax=unclassified Rhizobium TaxID=2613769 RepID=UPI000714B0BF|nr:MULTISPECIES: HepT-like ribonuclease domain-containing protein [unclassified Rhizobium]KQV37448.1 hypothetical protein ASC96_05160 [Rhizobium sp. Root1204]KQY17472.1 hypothetical protein ASD36_02135 [Rhizobium sp. Root1334]KRC13353.1 hypothetical protein ASE23_02135 [Rhizobium sp. Root73]